MHLGMPPLALMARVKRTRLQTTISFIAPRYLIIEWCLLTWVERRDYRESIEPTDVVGKRQGVFIALTIVRPSARPITADTEPVLCRGPGSRRLRRQRTGRIQVSVAVDSDTKATDQLSA